MATLLRAKTVIFPSEIGFKSRFEGPPDQIVECEQQHPRAI